MTTALVYDGTFNGFLTSIFEVYERKIKEFTIVRTEIAQASLSVESLEVITSAEKAGRVWAGLRKKLSKTRCSEVYKCFLSELPQLEHILSDFIIHVFSSHKNVENDFGHPAVLAITQIAHKVHREKHRMEAFVRFQLTKDGIYFAAIQPDFNVLPLIISHFSERYADQEWLIYDSKRKYGIHFDRKSGKVSEVSLNLNANASGQFLSPELCHEDEKEYQRMWKGYFVSVNIGSRKNEKLHVRHVPKRYWKFLTEKQDSF